MPLTIARLRQGILILASLLFAVLIGFFVYARYRLHRFEKDLPGRLGVNIEQTASGYTYSQSSKGHTLYTIRASKLVQYKQGGNATLHDVAITLYGPVGSSRVDKIYGSDFSYDAKDQIVAAQGTVTIDLQGFGKDGQAASLRNTIHVRTSGLVFNEKTAQADTSQYTEFSFPRASGSSVGAHYNSRTGVLVLDSRIQITTVENGSPAAIRASHAQVERDSSQAFLLSPRTRYKSEQGSADSAIVSFRPDGSAQSIDAHGNVRIVGANGSVVSASSSLTQLNDESQPLQTQMTGGVSFASDSPDESMHGTAGSGTLTFSSNSTLQHAQFRNAVRFVDQTLKRSGGAKGSALRQMQASQLDVDFVGVPDGGRAVASKATAAGNAQLILRTVSSHGPQQATAISGDQLTALLTPSGKAVRQLNGSGHTKITDLASDGSTSTSSGDRLAVTFAAQPASSSRLADRTRRKPTETTQAFQIESAIQDGNVVLTQTARPKAGSAAPAATLTAWAQHADYRAADQVLHLAGSPRLADGLSLQLAASQIDYHRDSGDARAAGSVKATYVQQTGASSGVSPTLGGNGPVHITADHALLRRQGNVSTFYGGSAPGAANARMWQGGDSVAAPVLELTRAPQTLRAYGSPGGAGPEVQANLLSTSGPADPHPGVVRVRSRTFFYSDTDRRGDFHGSVVAQNASGVIHADQAQVYLLPAGSPGSRPEEHQGQLDRIVATGHVILTQPGRRGTGEKLVYTARSGSYVLSGAPGNPPRIEDAAKGTTTGATLIFNSQDDSVVVSGGHSSAVTETRAPK